MVIFASRSMRPSETKRKSTYVSDKVFAGKRVITDPHKLALLRNAAKRALAKSTPEPVRK